MKLNFNWYRSFLLPVSIVFFFLLDGIVAQSFSSIFYVEAYKLVPRMMLVVFIIYSFYFPRERIMIYAIIFGFLYDMYYGDILGIYVALIPLVVYVTEKAKNILSANPFIIGMMLVIDLSLFEIGLYGVYRLLGVTTMNFPDMLSERLGPSLLLNLAIFIIIFYPIYKFIQFLTKKSPDLAG